METSQVNKADQGHSQNWSKWEKQIQKFNKTVGHKHWEVWGRQRITSREGGEHRNLNTQGKMNKAQIKTNESEVNKRGGK